MRLSRNWRRPWPTIDFLVHAIAYSDKSELTGRFLNTTRQNFKNSMDISCYSFIEVARRAYPMMKQNGGTLLTLTYQGSNRVAPNYNVMGVAKAALEATTRYLANDLGPDGIRVNAISPGPMKTLAGAAIGGARRTFRHTEENAPLRSNATLEAVGGTAVYLASPAGAFTSGRDHPRRWRVPRSGHAAGRKPLTSRPIPATCMSRVFAIARMLGRTGDELCAASSYRSVFWRRTASWPSAPAPNARAGMHASASYMIGALFLMATWQDRALAPPVHDGMVKIAGQGEATRWKTPTAPANS